MKELVIAAQNRLELSSKGKRQKVVKGPNSKGTPKFDAVIRSAKEFMSKNFGSDDIIG